MSGPPEVVLRSRAVEVSFLPELGGRIHRLRAFGHDLLRTPDDPATHGEDPFFWGAYPMAPWCNRAPAGRGTVAGRVVELAANFPDGTAIHGLAARRPWQARDDGTLGLTWSRGSEWPWPFAVRLALGLHDAELQLDYRLTNLADEPMPAGLGLHPWFRRPIELRVPAAAAYASNVASAVDPQRVTGAHDLRSLGAPADGLDGTWTALAEPAIDLSWPTLGVRATLDVRSSAGTALVAVACPEGIEAVAIEPQTHGPDPFRRLAAGEPDAPVVLAPGADLRLRLRLRLALARDLRE